MVIPHPGAWNHLSTVARQIDPLTSHTTQTAWPKSLRPRAMNSSSVTACNSPAALAEEQRSQAAEAQAWAVWHIDVA
jgi:hypothetical protein